MIAVIIISWNVRDLLCACLQSLQHELADLPVRVIVVDSASADGSAAMVRADFPAVELVACAENIGYVKGNNLALRMLGFDGAGARNDASPEFVWLLNPDTIVKPGCAHLLLAFMRERSQCGLCAPMLTNPDGTLQHGSFEFPGLMQLLIDTQPRLARLRNTRWDGRYSPEQYAARAPFRAGA